MKRLALVSLIAVACGSPSTPPPTPPTPNTPVAPSTPVSTDDYVDEPAPEGPSNSPVSLTASDGTGLKIVSFEAKAVVQDPLAFTELHLVFENPEPRVVEGQFEITLPSTATLSRFAMKQDWGWQEGEVVELQAARRAYEDFLHRRQDPALLEKQPGNQFHARVFPIPPSGKKEIILSYSEAMARSGEPYRIHLRGLPVLAHLDVHATVGRKAQAGTASSMGGTRFSNEVIELHKQSVVPDADFTIALSPVSQQPQAGLRNQRLVVARITPVTAASPDLVQGGLYVLFDSSASRALGFDKQVTQLAALLAELGKTAPDVPLTVACFDQDVEEVYAGKLSGFGEEAQKKILARRPLGASDLAGALSLVGKRSADSYRRVLVVTDGIATSGKTEPAAIGAAATALGKVGFERLDAVVSGGIRDQDALKGLVTAGLTRDGVVLDAAYSARTLARRLNAATISHLKVTVPHSAWSWPLELNGVQPGDQVLVYADVPADQPFTVNLDGAQTHFSYPVPLAEIERPLIERAAVKAQLDKLEAERVSTKDPKLAALLKKQEVELSTKFRVLCDHTALLVLESEEDYARFQIDRRALSDILTVGPSGIEVMSRLKAPAVANPTTPPTDQPTDQQARTTVKRPPAKAAENKPDVGGKDKEGLVDTGRFGKKVARDDLDDLAIDGKLANKGAAAAPMGGATAMDGDGVADPQGEGQGRGNAATGRRHDAEPPRPVTISMPPPAPSPSAEPAAAAVAHDERDRRAQRAVVARPGYVGNASAEPQQQKIDPYTGKLKEVMSLVAAGKLDAALDKASAWRSAEPGDVLALIALGEVYEKKRQPKLAARAYGSIIDLFPGRADLRRFAGERMERLGAAGLDMAIDTFDKARAQRPDHPASHRLLAFALLRAGRVEEAFKVIVAGAAQTYPDGRFRGVDQILREDVGLIAAAWIKQSPKRRTEIEKLVAAAGAQIPTEPSVRFVLNWETDGNDVDFHIYDAQGNHSFFSQMNLASGGSLYADVTTGYGPECFTIPGKASAYPYKLQAHYYSRGPMGYGMGKLEIVEHDGQGGFRFEERPFVIMVDHAFVELGSVKGPLFR